METSTLLIILIAILWAGFGTTKLGHLIEIKYGDLPPFSLKRVFIVMLWPLWLFD